MSTDSPIAGLTPSRGPRLQPGEVVGERYQVESVLASGGMGCVYLVRDSKTGRRRAMKMLHERFLEQKDIIRRFEIEIAALNEVQNDFIVDVLDTGIDATRQSRYLVMEYVDGLDLQTIVERQGAIEPSLVVAYLAQISCALDAIHAKGIVHRDLKPANLVLRTRSDGSPEVKLLDFGVSKFVRESSLGKTTIVAGTAGYMAPEQIAGTLVNCKTDIFALGQVAYTLIYGRPFSSASDKPFSNVRSIDAKRFDAWFQKAVANDMRKRFSTASEAIASLRGTLSAERRQRITWLAAATLVTVVFAIAGAFVMRHRLAKSVRTDPTVPAVTSNAPALSGPTIVDTSRTARVDSERSTTNAPRLVYSATEIKSVADRNPPTPSSPSTSKATNRLESRNGAANPKTLRPSLPSDQF